MYIICIFERTIMYLRLNRILATKHSKQLWKKSQNYYSCTPPATLNSVVVVDSKNQPNQHVHHHSHQPFSNNEGNNSSNNSSNNNSIKNSNDVLKRKKSKEIMNDITAQNRAVKNMNEKYEMNKIKHQNMNSGNNDNNEMELQQNEMGTTNRRTLGRKISQSSLNKAAVIAECEDENIPSDQGKAIRKNTEKDNYDVSDNHIQKINKIMKLHKVIESNKTRHQLPPIRKAVPAAPTARRSIQFSEQSHPSSQKESVESNKAIAAVVSSSPSPKGKIRINVPHRHGRQKHNKKQSLSDRIDSTLSNSTESTQENSESVQLPPDISMTASTLDMASSMDSLETASTIDTGSDEVPMLRLLSTDSMMPDNIPPSPSEASSKTTSTKKRKGSIRLGVQPTKEALALELRKSRKVARAAKTSKGKRMTRKTTTPDPVG